MRTWTSLNHEFLRWSVAHNQNTVATARVAREGGQPGKATPVSKFQSFQVIKIFEVGL